MSRPDIRIATITRTVQGKACLFTAIYFRTSLIKGYEIYKSINYQIDKWQCLYRNKIVLDVVF